MRVPIRLLLAVATGAAACVLAGTAAGGPNASALVLRLGDLPAGFAVSARHVVTNATAADEDGKPLSLYAQWGRLTGYEVDFDRKTGTAGGPTAIASIANVYRTAKGASASLAASKAVCAQAPFKVLALGRRIGDGAVLCRAATTSGGKTLEVYALTWRHGTLKLIVMAAGVRGNATANEAVRLARRLDRRLAATTHVTA